jgi:hypothetical protein
MIIAQASSPGIRARGIAIQRSLGLHQIDREYHLRQPFQRQPDFAVTSVNYDFADRLARAVDSRHQLSKAAGR